MAPAAKWIVRPVLTAVFLLVLAGCEDEEARSAQLEDLQEELVSSQERLAEQEKRLAEVEKQRDELEEENRAANLTIRSMQEKLERAGEELAEASGELGKAKDAEPGAVAKVEEKVEEKAKGGEVADVVKEEAPAMPVVPAGMEQRKVAKKKVYEMENAVVTIEGDRESGSGMLVTADAKVWLYTAASLVGANRKLKIRQADGSVIEKFGTFEVAPDFDLVRFEVPAGSEAAVSPSAEAVKLGSLLLGLDDGITLEGKVATVEAALFTVSSELAQERLGLPIFHGESGGFLGVLGAARGGERTLWSGGDNGEQAALVAYRIGPPVEWVPVPIGNFLQEIQAIKKVDDWTRLAEAFLVLNPTVSGLDFRASVGTGGTVEDIFAANDSDTVVRSAIDLNAWLEERGARSSASDLKRRISSIYSEIHSKLRAQLRDFEKVKFSPANAPAAGQSLKWCRDVEKRLAAFEVRVEKEKEEE